MELLECARCGCAVHPNEVYYIGEEPLCRDCADTHTVICERCEERIWDSDDRGDENTSLCSSCYERYYTRCVDCNKVIPLSAACFFEEDRDESNPYCEDCFAENEEALHCYSYKPNPIFYGKGPRFMGVELEMDDGGRDSDNARKILSVFNQNKLYGYMKTDGSLEDGLELVTHPCSLAEHRACVPWAETLEKIKRLGYYSHQSGTCGLHVHVSRLAFGGTEEEQDNNIAHILYLFERFWEELLRFSRRTERQVDQWAARYGYKNSSKEILEDAKKSHKGRYTCVNLTNAATIEFRIFRGTLKYNTLIATLELIDKLCDVAISMSEEELKALSWSDIMVNIDETAYPELIRYLKERRLYINEPIIAETEV